MKAPAYYLLVLTIFILGTMVPAQDDYIVGEKDLLDIRVYGEPEMSTVTPVSSQGTITFWVLGEVEVGGKSISQIKSYLSSLLEDGYIKNPVVDIRIKEFRSKEINIQGAVVNPGTYTLDTNNISLLKLLSRAGGTTESVGSRAYIIRGAATRLTESTEEKKIHEMEERIEVDLHRLLRQGELSEDKIVYGGDFVFLATKAIEHVDIYYIWVDGAVENPGQIPYQEGLTAFQACIMAGGLTGMAAARRAKINRMTPDEKTQVIKVNLKAIRKGKKPDVSLKPGDRITVPLRIF